MNETYEGICKYINWSDKTDTDAIKFNLMQDYTKEEIEEAENYGLELKGKLCNAGIEEQLTEENGYYGDSVHDMLCELVAHGEEYVNAVIDNPQIAINRFKDDDYTENFFYCFPYDEDWDSLSHEVHIKNAEQGLEYIKEAREEFGTMYRDEYMNEQGGFDFDMAYNVMDEVKNLIFNSYRDYETIHKATKNLGHDAYFANIWSDFGKSYVKLHTECVVGHGIVLRKPELISN
jgi:hypothetical protein